MNDKIEAEAEIEGIRLRRLGGWVPCERAGAGEIEVEIEIEGLGLRRLGG